MSSFSCSIIADIIDGNKSCIECYYKPVACLFGTGECIQF